MLLSWSLALGSEMLGSKPFFYLFESVLPEKVHAIACECIVFCWCRSLHQRGLVTTAHDDAAYDDDDEERTGSHHKASFSLSRWKPSLDLEECRINYRLGFCPFDDGSLVTMGIGIGTGATECLGPVSGESLDVLGVEAVAEGMADHVVGKATQAIVRRPPHERSTSDVRRDGITSN